MTDISLTGSIYARRAREHARIHRSRFDRSLEHGRLEADTIIWAAGVMASPAAWWLDAEQIAQGAAGVFGREDQPKRQPTKHANHELTGNIAVEQPIPVLAEHGRIPHRIVCREPDEPAEQQIIVPGQDPQPGPASSQSANSYLDLRNRPKGANGTEELRQ